LILNRSVRQDRNFDLLFLFIVKLFKFFSRNLDVVEFINIEEATKKQLIYCVFLVFFVFFYKK